MFLADMMCLDLGLFDRRVEMVMFTHATSGRAIWRYYPKYKVIILSRDRQSFWYGSCISRIGRGYLIGSLEQAERDMFAHCYNVYFYSVWVIEMSLEFSLGSVTLYCNVMDALCAKVSNYVFLVQGSNIARRAWRESNAIDIRSCQKKEWVSLLC